jgi:beta-lactamase superfamily II metal-dependent hydrolase
VVHTVGRGNRWRFPHSAVTRRYAALGSRQFRSDRHGSVSFHSRAGRLDWRSLRDPPRRIWRRW